MQRRNFIVGVGTIVLGGSGFVASGAVDVDSIGGSRGQGWVRLDDPDIDEPEEVVTDEVEDEEHDPGGEIRVQIVTDPSGRGANRTDRLEERPRIVNSRFVHGDDDGFLEGIDLDAMNVDAESWIGRTAGSQRRRDQEVAFMISNVGGVGQPDRAGQTVDITFSTFSDATTTEAIETDALRFPWAVDERTGGENLAGTTVRLPPRASIGVSIVVDGSDRAAEVVEAIGIRVDRIASEVEDGADES